MSVCWGMLGDVVPPEGPGFCPRIVSRSQSASNMSDLIWKYEGVLCSAFYPDHGPGPSPRDKQEPPALTGVISRNGSGLLPPEPWSCVIQQNLVSGENHSSVMKLWSVLETGGFTWISSRRDAPWWSVRGCIDQTFYVQLLSSFHPNVQSVLSRAGSYLLGHMR